MAPAPLGGSPEVRVLPFRLPGLRLRRLRGGEGGQPLRPPRPAPPRRGVRGRRHRLRTDRPSGGGRPAPRRAAPGLHPFGIREKRTPTPSPSLSFLRRSAYNRRIPL